MKKEEVLYVVIWICGILHALQRFAFSSRNHHLVSPDDFDKGYKFLNRMKDSSDTEWTMLTSLFKSYWPLLFIQVAVCQFILRCSKKVLPFYYAIYSLFCLVLILGIAAASVFILLIYVILIISSYGRKEPCYIFIIVSLLLLHNPKFEIIKALLLDTSGDTFLFDVALAWLLAKCLSFSVDRIESHVHKRISCTDVATVVAYCLYLPTVFSGPIISFEKFCNEISTNAHLSLNEVLLRIQQTLLYFLLWYFVYEILLHFVFSSAIAFHPEILSEYDSPSLCGLGYALYLMFYLKYFVIYGISGSFAQLEGIHLPPPPKCISCVHRSSFLSRHFDRGLYLWLLKYLYRPVINGNYTIIRKIFAGWLCFSFVCLWHGLEESICIWSALNCLLLLSEVTMHFILTTHIGKKFEQIPFMCKKRFSAAVATPHFICMCISCTFFLSNSKIAILLIKRVILGGVIPFVPFAIVMYCGCHVSIFFKQCQEKNVYV